MLWPAVGLEGSFTGWSGAPAAQPRAASTTRSTQPADAVVEHISVSTPTLPGWQWRVSSAVPKRRLTEVAHLLVEVHEGSVGPTPEPPRVRRTRMRTGMPSRTSTTTNAQTSTGSRVDIDRAKKCQSEPSLKRELKAHLGPSTLRPGTCFAQVQRYGLLACNPGLPKATSTHICDVRGPRRAARSATRVSSRVATC